MSTQNPARTRRPDPRRLVTGAKVATLVGSVVGFGALAGLILADPAGSASPATVTSDPGAAQPPAGRSAAQPTVTPTDDFFSPPPGFSARPPQTGGAPTADQGGSGGFSGPAGGLDQGFSGPAGGFGGVPGMRSGGS